MADKTAIDKAPDLGELEREVMQLVWAAGEATAETIREQLSRGQVSSGQVCVYLHN